ncbi:MAG: DUF4340 domain-containing protein [Elusimicrobia bacterium]|nr:DUF4340 domain-containing protein [Elusimicrobiota bacterium]
MRFSTVKALWISSGVILAAVIAFQAGRGLFESKRFPPFLSKTKDPENNIVQISIERLFFDKITLEKNAQAWRMTSPVDYPVQDNAVKDMVQALASAVVEEKISERKDKFLDFELDQARSIRLTVRNSRGKTALDGRIGKQLSGSWDRSYFAFEGSSTAYVVKGLPRYYFEKRPNDLRSRLMFEASKERVAAVILSAGKKSVAIKRDGNVWKVGGKPAKEDKVGEIIGMFGFLEANDFAEPWETKDGLKKLGLEGRPATIAAKIETLDGKKYELLIGHKKDTMYFAKLADQPVIWKLADWKVSPLLIKEDDLRAAKTSSSN